MKHKILTEFNFFYKNLNDLRNYIYLNFLNKIN